MPARVAGDYRQRIDLTAAIILLLTFSSAIAFPYKVGDLNSWGAPPPPLPNLYSTWSLNHRFKVGDSLLFLYPPSQDFVLQVTERAFNACSMADPVLKMTDGNSIFDLATPGTFYFTSGVPGRCEKRQKLRVDVPDANGTFFLPPADGPAVEPAAGPAAFPLLFGPTPAGAASSSPDKLRAVAGFAVAVAVLYIPF